MKTMMMLAAASVIAAVLGPDSVPAPDARSSQQFDHTRHVALFPSCTACHSGIVALEGGQAYPDPGFCTTCHDGRTQPVVDWTPPREPSRANLRFGHGQHPGTDQCATCHVRDETVQRAVVDQCLSCHGIEGEHHDPATPCTDCHVQPPAPRSHEGGFRDRHAEQAAASPETCATCHVRSDCLDCHRPGAASGSPGYHPADFLARHPVAAYTRELSCSNCHNVASFCAACHQQAGLVAAGPIGGGYHDAKRSFVGGHGQAARQSLESCVACHTEQDCVRCHVNTSPHGPGFDAEKLRKANAEVCIVCHKGGIPTPN
ncbi:MAG: hypothetical protein GTN62_00955 [Gemmatimonadales bacterium]|nr:hypothetical protein [Gemmatimonadales bacterium]NIN48672.1 hypothetical protein [Gemmatimonadales bacterium]NIP06136.1 hypothetical protein [Gemmatimonadales bacterium]NIR01310.1 hypothetical protein [Gemmatimonadales bacterium]